MGIYVNPGDWAFRIALQGEYVDKTGLISLVNASIDTPARLICVSRARRFGKSYAAQMLTAYYSCGCDSRSLFENLEISGSPSFSKHINTYNVIRLDMTDVMQQGDDVVSTATRLILDELKTEFSGSVTSDTLTLAIIQAVHASNQRFVFVIDEWDAPIRERDEASTRRYVEFLRSLFKNASFTAEAVAAAYITGILPIKKYNTQSAMSEFREYTMLMPGPYAPYVGFTEGEVRDLCACHGMNFEELRRWYDGYELPDVGHVYAPFSVMRAIETGRVRSYWTSTASYDSVLTYIERDFDSLQNQIAQLVAGERLPVNTDKFSNDMREIHSSDDVLTVLAHLGYLAYDEESQTVRIPNEEVRREFVGAMEQGSHPEIMRMVSAADNLLQDTINGDEIAVALAVQAAHDSRLGPDWYNDEQALRFAVKLAYLTAVDKFAEIEELPSGHGRADVVYLPRRYSPLPAMVVELKWDKDPDSTLNQIRSKNYPKVLQAYGGPVLLVGIIYDSKTKEHTCRIERMRKE